MVHEVESIRGIGSRRRRAHWIWCVVVLVFGGAVSLKAQNRRLETTGGGPLQTESLRVVVPTAVLAPMLSFDFAFATEERLTPGTLLDSLTFSVQMIEQRKIALLLTVDGSGLKLAPNTPGAFQLNLNALKAASIEYFGALSDPAQRVAYHVDFLIPGELGSGDAELSMDLFSNGDSQKSVGTLANIIIVPEPSVVLLVALGAVLIFTRKAR